MKSEQNFNISRPQENPISDAEKMRSYLDREHKKLAEEFRERQKDLPPEERINISADFRIVPPKSTFSKTQQMAVDANLIKNHGSANPEKIKSDENRRAGFLFEMLKTSIMHKKIGERFIVVRSSHYDDGENKVDNILVDRKTGHTVCALDEVSPRSMQDPELEKKKEELKAKNSGFIQKSEGFGPPVQIKIEHGVKLKYGIDLTEGKISCKEINHLPIFLLSLDHTYLNKVLRQFQNGTTSSDFENRLFKYFLEDLSWQIKKLKLDPQQYAELPNDMRARIESFESFLIEQGIK